MAELLNAPLFEKYTKINDARFAKSLYGELPGSTQLLILEKIHGSNFCVVVSRERFGEPIQVKFARREAFLPEGERFNSYRLISDTLGEKCSRMVEKHFRDASEERIVLRVWGELFGLDYPGVASPAGTNPVQRGKHPIYYSPDLEFYVFDISANDVVLAHSRVEELCDSVALSVLRPVHRCTLTTLTDFDVETFQSTLYRQVSADRVARGLSALPELTGNNLAEGIVVKTDIPQYVLRKGKQVRVIFKLKHSSFNERATGVPRKSKTLNKPTTDNNEPSTITEDPLMQRLQTYVTPARLECVLSKMLDSQVGNYQRVAAALANDIIENYSPGNDDDDSEYLPLPTIKEEHRKMNKALHAMCIECVRDFFTKM